MPSVILALFTAALVLAFALALALLAAACFSTAACLTASRALFALTFSFICMPSVILALFAAALALASALALALLAAALLAAALVLALALALVLASALALALFTAALVLASALALALFAAALALASALALALLAAALLAAALVLALALALALLAAACLTASRDSFALTFSFICIPSVILALFAAACFAAAAFCILFSRAFTPSGLTFSISLLKFNFELLASFLRVSRLFFRFKAASVTPTIVVGFGVLLGLILFIAGFGVLLGLVLFIAGFEVLLGLFVMGFMSISFAAFGRLENPNKPEENQPPFFGCTCPFFKFLVCFSIFFISFSVFSSCSRLLVRSMVNLSRSCCIFCNFFSVCSNFEVNSDEFPPFVEILLCLSTFSCIFRNSLVILLISESLFDMFFCNVDMFVFRLLSSFLYALDFPDNSLA